MCLTFRNVNKTPTSLLQSMSEVECDAWSQILISPFFIPVATGDRGCEALGVANAWHQLLRLPQASSDLFRKYKHKKTHPVCKMTHLHTVLILMLCVADCTWGRAVVTSEELQAKGRSDMIHIMYGALFWVSLRTPRGRWDQLDCSRTVHCTFITL